MKKECERETSWERSSSWYDKIVGEKGHYYHESVILPALLPLMQLERTRAPALLDLACGQGILGRRIDPDIDYWGYDISKSLIDRAARYDKNPRHRYGVADVTEPLPTESKSFSHAVICLALQNIAAPQRVMQNAGLHLRQGGRLYIVLNHPCYRIPRNSSWAEDEKKNALCRKVDSYLTPLEIPIQTHPSQKEASELTYAFHHPLSSYSQWLQSSGFYIERIEEWCSDKISQGKQAKRENRCRGEFPLFMTLIALKK